MTNFLTPGYCCSLVYVHVARPTEKTPLSTFDSVDPFHSTLILVEWRSAKYGRPSRAIVTLQSYFVAERWNATYYTHIEAISCLNVIYEQASRCIWKWYEKVQHENVADSLRGLFIIVLRPWSKWNLFIWSTFQLSSVVSHLRLPRLQWGMQPEATLVPLTWDNEITVDEFKTYKALSCRHTSVSLMH